VLFYPINRLAIRRPRIYYEYTASKVNRMTQSIVKWGNSLAFRIPAAIAKQMEIDEGAEVEFRIDGKRLVIEKAAEMPRFTHQDLVKALRKAKKTVVELGSPRGKEVL
jgi:antitoxin component of MazEF toxin-antitoxin module